MANSKRKCRGCHSYIPAEDVYATVGLGAFCSEQCLVDHHPRDRRHTQRRQVKKERQRKRGTPEHVRRQVIERDNGRCRFCMKAGAHVHHVVYRSGGGEDVPENLVLLCEPCHGVVHSSKRVYQPLLLTYLWGFYAERKQSSIPAIARDLWRSGDLDDLAIERLGFRSAS